MKIRKIPQRSAGLRRAPLGNMVRAIPEDEALGTVEAAGNADIRYFDTAPLHGAGFAEIGMGLRLRVNPEARGCRGC